MLKNQFFILEVGCINSGPKASKLVKEFVQLTGIPSTMTLMGLGTLPASNSFSLGMLGMHGMYEANLAMHECDVMVNIGARLMIVSQEDSMLFPQIQKKFISILMQAVFKKY